MVNRRAGWDGLFFLVLMMVFARPTLSSLLCRPLVTSCRLRQNTRPFLVHARWMTSGGDSQKSPAVNNLITSTKSNTVKKIQALLTKRKKRTELQSTVVEGPRMVFDLLKNEKTKSLVQHVLISTDQNHWTQTMLQQYPDVPIHQGTPEVLAACSDTVTPQGIVATVSIPIFEDVDRKRPLYLVLDGVSDPGNTGTLLRSCVAVGVAGVVLLPQCCDVWNPKAVRSAMGCTFQVPITSVDSFQNAQTFLSQRHVDTICAATMDDESGSKRTKSIPHYEIDWVKEPTALIIGSEGTGLSDKVRRAVSEGEIKTVYVPMEPGIESLNAAVCGSVILFEYLRQCRTVEPTS